MTFFFLVVGLEAKRELDTGELRERQRLAIPVVAALGGMALPIAIYLAFNAGGGGAHGWGAAMSTDTAFALGVLALLAPRGTRLRLRLLTLAVVDDLVALVVIATVYTEHLSLLPLCVGRRLLRRSCSRSGTRRSPGAGRPPSLLGVGALGRAVRVRHRPGRRGTRGRARDERLSARPRRPRAGDRADALLPRAAHARARPLSAAERGVRDLGERAASVHASPVDELRDRAPVRARKRRHPHRRAAARRRGHLADHARHRVRLRGGQAARDPGRVLARLEVVARAACAGR